MGFSAFLVGFGELRLRRYCSVSHLELAIPRFFNLDTAAYREGALDAKTKELLGDLINGAAV
jgi:hypothetical protein